MALIIEKGYDDVKVQDILDKANVGRTTFYLHYESKEQLLLGNSSFQDELLDIPFDEPDKYPFGINLGYFFKFSPEYLDLYKALEGSKALEVLSNHFEDLFVSRIEEYHRRFNPQAMENPSMFPFRAHAAAGAIISMYLKWLQEGSVYPAEELISLSKKILNSLLREE